jgi:agarase
MNAVQVFGFLVAFLTASAAASAASGFFEVRQIDGRWWFVDPDGNRFLSKGVTTVLLEQDFIQGTKTFPYADAMRKQYGTVPAWRQATAAQLAGWNVNTLGCWSDPEVAHASGSHLAWTGFVGFAGAAEARVANGAAWKKNGFPDPFDPEFAAACRATARERCAPSKNDRQLLGWFADNELRWGPDWRGGDELLALFLNLPAGAPGRRAAFDFLRARHPDVAGFDRLWETPFASWDEAERAGAIATPGYALRKKGAQNLQVDRTAADPRSAAFLDDANAFSELAADRYFSVVGDALREADPNHLFLGCRFAIVPPPPVLAAAARRVDVISANCYDPRGPGWFLDAYAAVPKPVLIGEFAYRARDSGLPNAHGAGPLVDTQAERAERFDFYVRIALAKPNLVGYHWFEHADEPKEGRFDGEDSNYGVVSIEGVPYAALTQTMTDLNARAEALHEAAALPALSPP